ncbi:MAG: hypothetical protein O3A25_15680 [Acidobacteria bacterium]|nr:hypothetical protein [Acidobacteriota bacterium]
MSLVRISMSIVGAVGLVAGTLAAATIWLLLTDPVTVADAVSGRDVTPFVRQLAEVLYQAIRSIARYL